MGHVRAVLEDNPFRARDAPVDGFNDDGSCFVIPAREEQGWNIDLVQAISNIPVLECADDMELARPIHSVIDFRILGDLVKGAGHVIGPGIEATDMATV